ncbi:MAG: hypothetical protein QXU32_04340 [Nitrososphaerales archaeon]
MSGSTATENSQPQAQGEQDLIKIFETLVAKYGRTQNLNMFKYFHSPGFSKKHPADVNTIRYILDGNKVKVSCICGASMDLTDYTKLDKA